MKHTIAIIVIGFFIAFFFSCTSTVQSQQTNPEEIQENFSTTKNNHVDFKMQVEIFSGIATDEPVWVRPGELIRLGFHHFYPWSGESKINWKVDYNKLIVNNRVVGLNVVDDEVGITDNMTTLYKNSIKSIIISNIDRPHFSSKLLNGLKVVSSKEISITLNGLLDKQIDDLRFLKSKIIGLRIHPQHSSNCSKLVELENLRMLEIWVNRTYADPENVSRCLEFVPALENLQEIRITEIESLSRQDVYSLSLIDNLKRLYVKARYQRDIDVSRLKGINVLSLRADHSEFRISGLEHLKKLRKLSLRGSFVNQNLLKTLRLPKNLRELELESHETTVINLDFLQRVELLEKFSFRIPVERDINSFSNPYLALKNLAKINTLYMPFDPLLSDEDLKNIGALSELKSLKFSSYKVSSNGLKVLQNLKKLRFLRIVNHKIEEVDFSFIKYAENLEVLEYRGNFKKQARIGTGLLKTPKLRVLKFHALINPNDINSLRGLKSLQLLSFSWRDHFAGNSDIIEDMQKLEVLDLSGLELQSKNLKSVSMLRNLRTLNLTHAKVNSQGLKYISNLSNLQEINLRESDISDEGVQYIANIDSLENINLDKTNISDKSVQYIENMKNIKALSFYKTNITDRALYFLSKIPGLLYLDLSYCRNLTSNGISHLGKLKELRHLDLQYTKIDNKVIPVFYQLNMLKNLILSGTNITCPEYFKLMKIHRLVVTSPTSCFQ